jgi:hypothetical protein
MAESAKMFPWPDVRSVIPTQRWTRSLGVSSQHRFWSSGHYYLSCLQNYGEDDYQEIISAAKSCGVFRQIAAVKANTKDRFAVATFYGSEDARPGRLVFLSTSLELLLIEMEFYSEWNAEAQANLETYVAACEAELKRLL